MCYNCRVHSLRDAPPAHKFPTSSFQLQVSNFKFPTSSFQVSKFSSPQVFNTNGVFQTQNKQTSAKQLGHFDFPKPKNTNKHPTNNVVQVVFPLKTLTKQFDHFSLK